MLLADRIPVFIILGITLDNVNCCIWARAREKVYEELKDPDCHNSIDCNHEHEIVEQQFFNSEIMMVSSSESGGSGTKDKRSPSWNYGAEAAQKRSPIIQPSFDSDLIEREKREVNGKLSPSDTVIEGEEASNNKLHGTFAEVRIRRDQVFEHRSAPDSQNVYPEIILYSDIGKIPYRSELENDWSRADIRPQNTYPASSKNTQWLR